jgi:hypothetical protein
LYKVKKENEVASTLKVSPFQMTRGRNSGTVEHGKKVSTDYLWEF